MKRTISILLVFLAAQAAPLARAEATSYTVVLAGGASQSMIHIWLTPDGYSYVIDSVAPLEVGGSVCEQAAGNPTELICKAPLVAGFEVNAGPDDDSVAVARAVDVPVTIRGGPGRDTLIGGSGADKLIGGEGNDRILGHGGDDLVFGGPGNDMIAGGSGSDSLRGGPGVDTIEGGSGQNNIRQETRRI
jgi:hemolysin type calcium-binding protein